MNFVPPSDIDGALPAPSSKSSLQRLIAAAFLAEGQSELTAVSFCRDSSAALQIIRDLGAEITSAPPILHIDSHRQFGLSPLDCHESGLCLRMFAPILSLFDHPFTLTGQGSLLSRPVSMIEEPLRALGVQCHTNHGMLPVSLHGPLHPGRIEIDGSISSQFLSGLLMALPLLDGDSEIIVQNLKSKPYIDLTLAILADFGIRIPSTDYQTFRIPGRQAYRAGRHQVEGDWSGAAFLLVSGAIAGRITVSNLDLHSTQGDRVILEALQSAGAQVEIDTEGITVTRNPLKSFEFNAEECPDLFPPLAVLACACDGLSRIRGVERLIHKESNRAVALQTELTRLGASITLDGNQMLIRGCQLEGGDLDSHNDHRIAMAGAVAALVSRRGVTIHRPECVDKSYPGFFDDLISVISTPGAPQ